jgi:tRNA(Leu) C34 or U34 (ribose-2'-O)-methylase TrmL
MKRGFTAIGLKNPKFDTNISGCLRACGCFNADLVLIEGERYLHSKQDTQRAYKHIPVVKTNDLFSSKPFKSKIVAVELSDKASDIRNFKHPESAFYIFGPEDGSIPERDLNDVDYVISIPTKYCLNLAATVNVVLYDRLLKKNHENF